MKKESKGFFIENYKTLIIFSYIASVILIISNIYFKYEFNRNNDNPFVMRGLVIPNLILLFSDVIYILNYKKLVKEGKIQNKIGLFLLGFIPFAIATLINILVLIKL